MKILVVDDHEIARDGLKLQLEHLAQSCEVFEAGTCAEAIALALATPFELTLLDLTLPDSSGLTTLRRFRQAAPACPVVVLSGIAGREVVLSAIDEGAMGFIPKSASRRDIVRALEMILSGIIYVPPESLTRSTPPPPKDKDDGSALRLTERQLEVLRAAVQGKSNKLIADELSLSIHTVKAHLSSAMRVLGVTNRTEAVFKLARLELPLTH